MGQIPVFVSAPKSFLKRQEDFIVNVENELRRHDLRPSTLGRSQYDMAAPLEAVRRLMNGSCGLLCLGFRRTSVEVGTDRPNSDIGEVEVSRSGTWLTSPYSHIEPAMAYQIGLPILLWREQGVIADGVFDRGALGQSMPEFNLEEAPDLTAKNWDQPLREWIDLVRTVYRRRGAPIRLWAE
jgi:hypothetical protein